MLGIVLRNIKVIAHLVSQLLAKSCSLIIVRRVAVSLCAKKKHSCPFGIRQQNSLHQIYGNVGHLRQSRAILRL